MWYYAKIGSFWQLYGPIEIAILKHKICFSIKS